MALLQDWIGARTSFENAAAIYFTDVEAQTDVPKPRVARLHEVAAPKYNYTVDRKGDTLIQFRRLTNRMTRT